jgi:hypothetical protein
MIDCSSILAVILHGLRSISQAQDDGHIIELYEKSLIRELGTLLINYVCGFECVLKFFILTKKEEAL